MSLDYSDLLYNLLSLILIFPKMGKSYISNFEMQNMSRKIVISFFVLLIFSSFGVVYSSNFNLVWWIDYNGGGDDWAYGIATDSLDNVIVTGVSYDPVTYRGNYQTIKYDSNGNELWGKSYNSGGNDTAWGIATDSQSNIIVTGQSGSKYYTIKYDPNGNELWANGGITGPFGTAYDVVTDVQDNIIVAGTSGGKYYIIKYGPSGNKIWEKSYNAGGFDTAYAITTDKQNNIIVTGTSSKGGFTRNYHTVKFDLNGNFLWSKEYGGAGWDEAWGVSTDSENNIIVTGRAQTNVPIDYSFRYHTIKYDPNGNELWIGGVTGPVGVAWSLTTDSKDNIIVAAGYVNNGKRNYYTIAYSPEGTIVWSDIHTVGGLGEPWGVATDSEDNIIVAGSSKISGSDNYYTIKYKLTTKDKPSFSEVVLPNPKDLPMGHISRILGFGARRATGEIISEGNSSETS